MSEVWWTLPVSPRPGPAPAPTRGLTDPRPGRFTDFDRYVQVARAAEAAGFAGLLVPFDLEGDDPWITATTIAREVPRLDLVPEFEPGFSTAVYTAKLSQSFQRFLDDRLVWKPTLDDLGKAEELITVLRGVWDGYPFSFEGQHFVVGDGGFWGGPQLAEHSDHPLARRPRPPIVLEGTTDEELALSGRVADLHLFDLTEPAALAVELDRHRAASEGREVGFGLRLSLLARERPFEAWRDVERAWNRVQPGGAFDDHSAGPLRWDGFDQLGLQRPAGLVGSFDEIADELRLYRELGVTTFVLEAVDPLREAYPAGEFLLPLLEGVPA